MLLVELWPCGRIQGCFVMAPAPSLSCVCFNGSIICIMYSTHTSSIRTSWFRFAIYPFIGLTRSVSQTSHHSTVGVNANFPWHEPQKQDECTVSKIMNKPEPERPRETRKEDEDWQYKATAVSNRMKRERRVRVWVYETSSFHKLQAEWMVTN